MLGAARAAEVPQYLTRSSSSYAVLNMRHIAQAVLAQRKQNGSAHVPKIKNRMSIKCYEFGVINFDFKYDIILMVFK